MKYDYTKEVDISFDDAIEHTKAELQKEGFGVLSEIDVKATLKKKLDVDFDDYMILGACHPESAHQALQAEREIGLLLPCNVIVYTKDGKTFVSAIVPSVTMGMVENDAIGPIAVDVEERLKRVIEGV